MFKFLQQLFFPKKDDPSKVIQLEATYVLNSKNPFIQGSFVQPTEILHGYVKYYVLCPNGIRCTSFSSIKISTFLSIYKLKD